jgi:hypothetical protein
VPFVFPSSEQFRSLVLHGGMSGSKWPPYALAGACIRQQNPQRGMIRVWKNTTSHTLHAERTKVLKTRCLIIGGASRASTLLEREQQV